MSAWTRARPHHIIDNEPLLELLERASRSIQETIIPTDSVSDYRLREVLAACSRYPQDAGRYAGLAERVDARIRQLDERTVIVARSKLLSPEALRDAAALANDDSDVGTIQELARQMQTDTLDMPPPTRRSPFDLLR